MPEDGQRKTLDEVPHIVVEGLADEHALTHLLMRHNLFAHALHGKKLTDEKLQSVNIVVEHAEESGQSSGGKEVLLKGMASRIKLSNAPSIGFVLDADDRQHTKWNLKQTWQAVRDNLAAAGKIDLPKDIPKAGFFEKYRTDRTLWVGVWIMPDNEHSARLEEFLEGLSEGSDPLIAHAQDCTRAAKDQHQAKFNEKDFKKAELACWLAWQKQPGLSYGQALKEKYFQLHDTDLAHRFVDWVRQIIAPPSPT